MPKFELILLFWVCVTRYAQSTQNKMFAYLSNISSVGVKLIFCLQINTGFLQNDSITFNVRSQVCPKYPKQVCNISRKTWRMKLIFCLQVKVKKVSSAWYYHFICVWPWMSKLRKIPSLLFLCNFLRKKWVTKLIFCVEISMKAWYKLIQWFWWGWSSISKVPKKSKFAMSLRYLKKERRDEVDVFACR